MSKRSWLPTRKGTELFPGATHIPTVLRIKDVKPGTELYTAVANEYDGQLKQFHSKAQHAHALSPNPITKMRAQFGGEARATYTNIQGQETLELEVSRSTLEKLKKEISQFHRDVILISFEYEDMGGIWAAHAAFSRVPGRRDPLPADLLFEAPPILVASDRSAYLLNDGTKKPLLSFPPITADKAHYSEPFVDIPASGKQRSTLLWDTRAIPDLPVYSIDIYAQLFPDGNIGATCDLVSWVLNPENSSVFVSDTYTLVHEWRELYALVSGSETYPDDWYIPVEAAPENEAWDAQRASDEVLDAVNTYTPDIHDTDFILANDPRIPPGWNGVVFWRTVTFGEQAGGPGSHVATHNIGDQTTETTPTGNGTAVYSWVNEIIIDGLSTNTFTPNYQRTLHPAPLSRTCTVSAAFVDGAKLGISHTTGTDETVTFPRPECGSYQLGQDFLSFEVMGLYPAEPIAQKLGTAQVYSEGNGTDGSIANHLDMKFLCRITYNREYGTLSMTTEQ